MSAIYAILTIFFVGVIAIQEIRPQESLTEKITFKFNERIPTFSAESLELMSFGYPRILSNLLWLRILQQTPPDRVPPDELSWIYFDLDSITNIDPDFMPAFEQGGIFLSVVTTDKKGAELLLSKGTRLHPGNWHLHAYLAYHYTFELGQPDKAGQEYLIASRIPGAPPLMGLLAARYLAKTQSIQDSIDLLENLKKNSPDELTKKQLQARIDMWKNKLRSHE